MSLQLHKEYKETIKKIQNNAKVYAAVLFGSRAKGTSKSDSDYDIAVLMRDYNKETVREIEHLKTELLDIIPYNKIPFHVQTEVFKYGKPLFIKDDYLYTIELYKNMTEYQDNLHHYHMLRKYRVIK